MCLGFAAGPKLPTDNDVVFGEVLADLVHEVPLGGDESWRDELGADVTLAESSFFGRVHRCQGFVALAPQILLDGAAN